MNAQQTFTWLQALRLKGRSRASNLMPAVGADEETVVACLGGLEAEGLVDERDGFFGLSDEGEARRLVALEAERSTVDTEGLEALYAEFLNVNGHFKRLVTDAQLGDASPDEVLAELTALHGPFQELVSRVADAVPRLVRYGPRFDAALEQFGSGDSRYLASPLVDSYHTLWFEFHEELIQLSGRTRAAEEGADSGA